MQEEMAQRDVKTANRDQRVWAVAKGGDLKVDDSNLPPVKTLQSNKPDIAPFLSGEEAIKHMTVPKGCKVNLFASEEQFPELVSPVQMAFDTKGRLWVAAWPSYPERTPTSTKWATACSSSKTPTATARPTRSRTFLDDLNCPTGFQFYKDGVLVMQAPGLVVRARHERRRQGGLERARPDGHGLRRLASHGQLHGARSRRRDVSERRRLPSHAGRDRAGPVRNDDAAIYRFEPRTGKFERYVPYGFANPHGRVFDYWGNDIITDATGNNTYFGAGLQRPPRLSRPSTKACRSSGSGRRVPAPGTGIISSRHFPEEFQGNFLNCNVIGFQGIFRVKVTEDGSGLKGETIEDLVKGDNDKIPNFRPSAVGVAPDGSIYFLDWAKPLIGHMQHHIRDPNRDQAHGRIYRITYEGRPLLKPAKIDGQPIEKLLDLLKEPENDVRTRAKIELGKHDSAKVIAAVKKWTAKLDKNDKAYEHHMTEALWVHQWHNVVDEELLKRMLRSPDYHARAAATRVLCYWRDRVNDPLALLEVQAKDESPRVRLEAVRACSFFKTEQGGGSRLGRARQGSRSEQAGLLHQVLPR